MPECPSNKKEAAHMKMRQRQRLSCYSAAEEWAADRLKDSGLKWSRERIWRWRLYDFWNHELGCAIEIDGPEHDSTKDSVRDEADFKKSGIIVIRVNNFDEAGMVAALAKIKALSPWLDRRRGMGLLTRAQQRKYESNGVTVES